MPEPLPPPLPGIEPPLETALWRDRFDYWSAAQRHADMVAQTAAIIDATKATREHAAVGQQVLDTPPVSEQDRWWRLIEVQFTNDASGVLRGTLGTGNMTDWASQVADKARARYPA